MLYTVTDHYLPCTYTYSTVIQFKCARKLQPCSVQPASRASDGAISLRLSLYTEYSSPWFHPPRSPCPALSPCPITITLQYLSHGRSRRCSLPTVLTSRRPNTEAQLEQQSQRRLRGGARRHVEVGELLLEVVAGQPVELEDVEHLPGGLRAQVSGGVGTETSSTSTMSSAPNPNPNLNRNPHPNPNPNPNPRTSPSPNPSPNPKAPRRTARARRAAA